MSITLKAKSKLFGVVLILLTTIVACTTPSNQFEPIDSNGVIVPAPEDSETYKQGKTVYNTTCASCHGINGEGQFPEAPLKPDETGKYGAPPHNDDGHTWHHDDNLLLQIINDGGMGATTAFYPMPAFGDILSDEEKVAVLSYIKTMWNERNLASQYRVSEAVQSQQ